MKEIEGRLTEEEQKSIEDFEDSNSGVKIIKSKTGRIDENRCYGK